MFPPRLCGYATCAENNRKSSLSPGNGCAAGSPLRPNGQPPLRGPGDHGWRRPPARRRPSSRVRPLPREPRGTSPHPRLTGADPPGSSASDRSGTARGRSVLNQATCLLTGELISAQAPPHFNLISFGVEAGLSFKVWWGLVSAFCRIFPVGYWTWMKRHIWQVGVLNWAASRWQTKNNVPGK